MVPGLQDADSAGAAEGLGSSDHIRAWCFGIVGPAEAKSLETRWAKHRKENGLDRNGKLIEALSTCSAAHGPDRHSHDPTLRSQHLTSFETTPEGEAREGESVDEGFTLGANERWPR